MSYISPDIRLMKNEVQKLRFQGKYKEALQLIDRILKDKALNDKVKFQLELEKCIVLIGDRKYSESQSILNRLIPIFKKRNLPELFLKSNILQAAALRRSGNQKEALTKLKQIEETLKNNQEIDEINKLELEGDILYIKGMVQWQLGNLEDSQKGLKKCILIQKEIGNEEILALAYNVLGLTYLHQGNLKLGLKNFLISLDMNLKIQNKYGISLAYMNIGVVQAYRGDYEYAIECYERALDVSKEIDEKLTIAITTGNIGSSSLLLRNYPKALKCLKKSLMMIQDIHYDHYHSGILMDTISLLVSYDFESEDVNKHLENLKTLYEKNKENLTIKNRYDYARALVLKSSEQLTDKMQAQAIFKQIIEDKVIVLDNSVKSLFNLAELLLIEYKNTKSVIVLKEIEEYTDRLLKIGKEQKNYLSQAKTLLLKSKLELLKLNLDKANEFLKKAKVICKDHKLNKLAMTLIDEEESLLSKKRDLNEKILQEMSFNELVAYTEVGEVLTLVTKKPSKMVTEIIPTQLEFEDLAISLCCGSFTDEGVIIQGLSNNCPFTHEDNLSMLEYSLVLYLHGEYERLYGPFPQIISDNITTKNFNFLSYGFTLKDDSIQDTRIVKKEGVTIVILLIFYPKNLDYLFSHKKDQIQKLLKTKTDSLIMISNLTPQILESIKNEMRDLLLLE